MSLNGLLHPELAARCHQAILEVAEHLDTQGRDLLIEAKDPSTMACVASGRMGHALFYAYLWRAERDDRWFEAAVRLQGETRAMLARFPMSAQLFNGFPGVAWATDHLDVVLHERPMDDTSEIDEVLLRHVNKEPWRESFDLVRGLTGIGVYALHAAQRPAAAKLARLVVVRLEKMARASAEGIAWFTPNPQVPEHRQETYRDGYHDLGMAHGTPGLLAFLASAVAAGIEAERALGLLEGAVEWTLAQRSLDPSERQFDSFVAPGAPKAPGRSAWCYGALGVAGALTAAGTILDREPWQQAAQEIAREDIRRSESEVEIRDAGFCHGAVGTGHIYGRLYRALRDEELRQVADRCFERALDLRRPTRRVAGFASLHPDPSGNGTVHWHDDGGLVTGAAGVGLAMLAAIQDDPPSWDQLLGLSQVGTARRRDDDR